MGLGRFLLDRLRRKEGPSRALRRAFEEPMAPQTATELELDRRDNRNRFPHCDALVLHSPGACRYCDFYPDRQAGRVRSGIAFSDFTDAQIAELGLVPCPSTLHRTPARRDRWPGNVPARYGEPTPSLWGDLENLPDPEDGAA